MNILLVNWRDMKHPQAGGAEVHYHEIFRRLVAKGHTVVLLTTRFPGSARSDIQDGIIIHRWGNAYLFNWQTPFFIPFLLKKHRIDCIIDDINKIPFFTPKFFRRVPTGAFFHHLFGSTIFEVTAKPLARYILFLENRIAWAYRHTPCCTVSQSTLAELTARGFSYDNITIIENSVDIERFSRDRPAKKENDLLLYVGRLKRYKNLDIVMEAMRKLNERNKRLRLVICGSGDDEPRLRECARKNGVERQVTFAGHAGEEEKVDLYHRATLLVNPSIKEGWGITNIEANAAGTAVIANNAPGLVDSVRHGVTGLLYKFNDVEDLADCIRKLTDDVGLRQTMEREGRTWAHKFSWDNSAMRMEEWLIDKVMKKGEANKENSGK
ncbi:MAG: glycosyltransferase family 4 protein [Chitinispirillaceae bacterium]|jgi:glycosyltransferase involved in cell wall biosynthesis